MSRRTESNEPAVDAVASEKSAPALEPPTSGPKRTSTCSAVAVCDPLG